MNEDSIKSRQSCSTALKNSNKSMRLSKQPKWLMAHGGIIARLITPNFRKILINCPVGLSIAPSLQKPYSRSSASPQLPVLLPVLR